QSNRLAERASHPPRPFQKHHREQIIRRIHLPPHQSHQPQPRNRIHAPTYGPPPTLPTLELKRNHTDTPAVPRPKRFLRFRGLFLFDYSSASKQTTVRPGATLRAAPDGSHRPQSTSALVRVRTYRLFRFTAAECHC